MILGFRWIMFPPFSPPTVWIRMPLSFSGGPQDQATPGIKRTAGYHDSSEAEYRKTKRRAVAQFPEILAPSLKQLEQSSMKLTSNVIFWGYSLLRWPTLCGVCFSLCKSTSYLLKTKTKKHNKTKEENCWSKIWGPESNRSLQLFESQGFVIRTKELRITKIHYGWCLVSIKQPCKLYHMRTVEREL